MPVIFTYDFEDLIVLNNGLQSVLNSIPSAKSTLLRNIVSRYRGVILSQIISKQIRYTGTYEQSMNIVSGGTEENPTMSLVMEPQGPQAERLGIYWKVLEFGAGPSPNVLSSAIEEWASVKLGVGAFEGKLIANAIRSRGINPHPILSSIFVLTRPDGEVSGLTDLGITIAEEESQRIMDQYQRSWASQPRIPKGQPGGGRFTFRT